MTSLVIQTSFLGDMVLTTPLIAELAARGPVDVVATRANAPLLANNPHVRDLLIYDKRGADSGLIGLARMVRRVRRRTSPGADSPRSVNSVYLAQGSVRSATLGLLSGARERVGFDTSAGHALYTRTIPYREDLHHAARLLQLCLAEGSAIRAEQILPQLYPGPAERSAVDALLAAAGATDEPLIALAPGSAWATKRWPYYPALAAELAPGRRIVVVGSADDATLGSAIAAVVPGAIDATGKLSLLASAELIGRSRVLVTNDSAPLHLASAMRTPTVAIFGPTVPEFGFGPLAPDSAVARHHSLACQPCDRHGPQSCPLGHWRCMREITPDHVAALVRDTLSD